jgi:5-aminolevulinate synthase
MNYQQLFSTKIEEIKSEKRYREFLEIEYVDYPYAYSKALKRNIIVWCSNNYMGMAQHPEVLSEGIKTLQTGLGSGGTRNISGTNTAIVDLEATLANWYGKSKALVFTSGYVANQGTLSALGSIMPNGVIFSDEENHASIICGIKESRLPKEIFEHNSLIDLEKLLQKYDINQPKIIVFESLYSMSGSIAPIKDIILLAKKYNALTYIDEVHAIGVYGDKGSGLAEACGVIDDINIIQGTLGKAIGAVGGYIVADDWIIDAIRSLANSFIFTTTLPPVITNTARKSIEILQSQYHIREEIRVKSQLIKQLLSKHKIPFMHNDSHIIPIMVYDPYLAEQISKELLNVGIYIQHINFPTVKRGTERLRVSVSSKHTERDINFFIKHLSIIWKKYL